MRNIYRLFQCNVFSLKLFSFKRLEAEVIYNCMKIVLKDGLKTLALNKKQIGKYSFVLHGTFLKFKTLFVFEC
jgi:hypothetical protein